MDKNNFVVTIGRQFGSGGRILGKTVAKKLGIDYYDKELLFEALSALLTVGSSLGVTAELSDASKVLLSTAMFLGRVGLISLLTGLVRHSRNHGVTFPSDNIIIN